MSAIQPSQPESPNGEDAYGWLRRLGVDVRPDEARLTLTLFVYCFLIGIFQFSAKAVRNSTFIDELGADYLPLGYFFVAVLAYPVLRFYSTATERMPWQRVVSGTALLLSSSLVISWWLLGVGGRAVAFGLYLWLSIASVLAMSQFWLYANSLYDPRQARRLFGLLSAGGLLGGMLGGQVARLAALWETRATLLVGAVMLALVAVIVPITEGWRRREAKPPGFLDSEEEDPRSVVEVIRGNRLLQLISVVMVLGIIAGQVIDQQFAWAVEQQTTDLAERTAKFGNLYTLMGLSGFIFQLLVTTRIHRRLGVGFAMKVLPSTVFVGTLGLIVAAITLGPLSVAVIWILGGMKVGENGLRYALDQSTRELLFVAVPERDRRKAKAWIDVFVQRLGKTLAAVLLLSVTFDWITPLQASGLTLVVCALWLACASIARRDYVEALRESLVQTGGGDDAGREAEAAVLNDVTTLEALIGLLGSVESAKVLRSLDLLSAYGRAHLVPPLLLYHDDAEVRRRTLGILSDVGRRDALPLIEKLIGDEDPDVRVEAVRSLARLSGHSGPYLMQPRLRDPDLRVRSAAIACLANHGEEELVAEAEGALVELLTDGDWEVRLEAARALQEIGEPLYQQHLVTLLYDGDTRVAREAITAVARRVAQPKASPLYIPILIALLRDRRLKHDAREALIAYGENVISALIHFMNDTQEQIWVRRAVPKTLVRLGTPSAQAALVECLDADDLFLRRKVVEALVGLGRELEPELRAKVQAHVESECRCYLATLLQLLGISSAESFDLVMARVQWRHGVEPSLLQRLLAERMKGHLDNLFDLLTLLSESTEFGVVRQQLQGGRRSHALEYLDSVLPPGVRRSVLMVIDDLPLAERLREARRALELEVRPRLETLRDLMCSLHPGDETSPWIAAAAIQTICQDRETLLYDEVERCCRGDEVHPLVQETAQWARRQFAA